MPHSQPALTLSPTVSDMVTKQGMDPDDFRRILTLLTRAVPHLEFDVWQAWELEPDERAAMARSQQERGWAHYEGRSRHLAHCHVIALEMSIAAEVRGGGEPIDRRDLSTLQALAQEAGDLLTATSGGAASVTDFGLRSCAESISKLLGSPAEMVRSYLRSLRSLATETYENQRISYGLILTRNEPRHGSLPVEFDNKRFKRLTDGFSTALVLDRNGGVEGLVPLHTESRSKPPLGRPSWLGPLADGAARRNGVGVALTRGGDILISHKRELLFSRRGGRWLAWRHPILVDWIRGAWDVPGRSKALDRVIAALYGLTLELAFRRTGGLLVIPAARDKLREIVASAGDLMDGKKRKGAQRQLDHSLMYKHVQSLDRRVLADLASLDGALVVDRNGRLRAYGAMVRSSAQSSAQGARQRAALGASHFGLAIKISSDGDVCVFRRGELIVQYG